MLSFVLRQPFAILGAIGVVSLLKNVFTLQQDILFVINAFQAVTHPVWDFLFGWIIEWFGLSFPPHLKDYLTMGIINCGAVIRTDLSEAWRRREVWKPDVKFILSNIFFWTVFMMIVLWEIVEDKNILKKEPAARIYIEFLVWAAILIAVNYALFLAA